MRQWQSFTVIAAAFFFVSLALGQSAAVGTAESTATASTSAELPDWDVVSVKPVDAQDKCAEGSGRQTTPDGVHIFCVPVLFAIEAAYGIMDSSRIVGAPEWVKSGTRWNIDAKVAGEEAAAYRKLSRDDRNRMLRPLLADRFRLKAHMEQREMPVYDLVIAKGGSKLRQSTASDSAKPSGMVMREAGKIEGAGTQLTSLPWILNGEAGRPVVDKTGLTGKYDFTLEYVPASKAATDETGGPSIFTAVEEQLGLKLEPAKEPMDVLVIDSIAQPAAN